MDVGDSREAALARQHRQVQQRHQRETNGLRREVDRLRREVHTLRGLLSNPAGTQGTGVQLPPIATGERDRTTPAVVPAKDGSDLRAFSVEGYGLYAASVQGTGAYCRSFGEGDGLSALSERGAGVTAMSLGPANGVYAQSALGTGLHAVGGAALGNGQAPRPAAVFAEGGDGDGVYATSTSGDSLVARSASGCAVDGCSTRGIGVRARATGPTGIALDVEGRIRLHGCAIGEVCLPKGERMLTVSAAAAGADSLILLVLLDDPGDAQRIWIAARSAAQFVIGASAPARSAIRLQYLVIN